MRSFLFYILLALCTVFSATRAHAQNELLQVAVGWTKPPYVISQNNSGFELDLVRTIFAQLGHQVNFLYVPYGRSYAILKDNKADVVLTLKPGVDIGKSAVLSDSYVSYQNVIISLRKKNINIRRMQDIAKFSIVGFQNSHLHLGKAYAKAVARSPLYLEKADQRKQVEMLILGRIDLVVMDLNIFKYWLDKDHNQSDLSNVNVHRLFPKTNYHLGFNDAELKLAFNQSLAKFKQTEQYQRLLEHYKLEN